MSDDTSREASIQALMHAQIALSTALSREQSMDWLQTDLTMGQLKTMMVLAKEKSMTVGAIAERLNISKPAASILVDRLVQLGYAERTEDAEDRRRTLVGLTIEGTELTANMRRDSREMFTRWVYQMSEDDLEALERGLTALAAIAAREAVVATPR